MAKLVYQFNPIGELIKTHFSIREASISTGFKTYSISHSIHNNSIVLGSSYFSYDKKLKKPITCNPMKPMITSSSELRYIRD